MPQRAPARIYDALFSEPSMTVVFSDAAFLDAMLRVELALGAALEFAGIAPAGMEAAIASVSSEQLDASRLSLDARASGNLCIPFVKALTACVEKVDPAAAGYVHWGATSQDIQDTALMLQAQHAWALLEDQLGSLCASLASLSNLYRDAILPGRTWLQQGPPVTLGLKIAGWLDALLRHRTRMKELRKIAFVLQFGGAVGTLAPLRQKGLLVAEKLAAELNLGLPTMPWHTQRDRVAELAATLGLLTGTLGKIGRDLSLLMQTEVAECTESSGVGGSSTMPHKRNPVTAAIMLSASTRVPALVSTMLAAMVQEHERGLGGWHAEWETLPEIFRLSAGALDAATQMATALRADEIAMAKNLKILHGAAMAESLTFALAEKIGKSKAHDIVEEISRRALDQRRALLDIAAADGRLSSLFTRTEVGEILRPEAYLGSSSEWISRVLSQYRRDDAAR